MNAPISARERRTQELLNRYDKCAVASLVCALVGIAWPMGVLGFMLALAAIVLAVIGLQSRKLNVAIAGGAIGIVAALISAAMIHQSLSVHRSIDQLSDSLGVEKRHPQQDMNPLIEDFAAEFVGIIFLGFALLVAMSVALIIPPLIGWMFPQFKDEIADEEPEAIETVSTENRQGRVVPAQQQPRRAKNPRVVRRENQRPTPRKLPAVEQRPRDNGNRKQSPPGSQGRWIGKAWMPLDSDD